MLISNIILFGMKKPAQNLYYFIAITGLAVLFGCQKTDSSIRLMSYNIRFDNPADSLNAWTYRKVPLASMIRFYDVDIIAVQEALRHQLHDILDNLPGFSFVGLGRDDGDTLGEYSAIIYRSSRFRLLSSKTFWLSETPDKPSYGWDAACKRVCTWAIFKDRLTNKTFTLYNTHFDHVGKVSRRNSAQLLLSQMRTFTKNLPVIVTGDFNMTPTDSTIAVLTSVLADSYYLPSTGHYGPVGTWNGFDYNSSLSDRIDYCFVDSCRVEIIKHAHLDDAYQQRFPSDHLPVFVVLRIK